MPHFTVNVPDTEADMIERDMKTELGNLDQVDDVVDLGYDLAKLDISNDIQREFGMRIIYKDARFVLLLLACV